MNPITQFAEIIKQNNYNPSAVSDITYDIDGKLLQCFVSIWSGAVTVLEHNKNPDGSWDEIGHTIGTIIIDDDDNIITEIL